MKIRNGVKFLCNAIKNVKIAKSYRADSLDDYISLPVLNRKQLLTTVTMLVSN